MDMNKKDSLNPAISLPNQNDDSEMCCVSVEEDSSLNAAAAANGNNQEYEIKHQQQIIMQS